MLLRTLLSLMLLYFIPQVQAESIRLTMYDDGLSCPGNCDAHVVFEANLNGTEFAHSPSTQARPFTKCVNGQKCRICLESGGKQCLETIYRGGGPAPKTFDFTAAFYQKACATAPEQPLLAAKCLQLERAAKTLVGRINCIASPDNSACRSLMPLAIAARDQDQVKYRRCTSMGAAIYNRTVSASEKRSLNCAYEFNGTGGPNSAGTTWRRLLPGACRAGTFVGRDGLDCCSGILLADGPLVQECSRFYPEP